MKVLILGSGGREHALEWKIKQSVLLDEIIVAPGNGGNDNRVKLDLTNHDQILEFVEAEQIDLTIVGPEDPLVFGLVDKFENRNLRIFGPNQMSAQLEGSKDFAKEFMVRHHVPTAQYITHTHLDSAIKDLNNINYPLVIKADGLALGKGVRICENELEATSFLNDVFIEKVFGESSVLFEEFLTGTEASLLCFVSDNKLFPLQSARDYKRIHENDEGLNTGGVGCYSPSELFDAELDEIIRTTILNPIEQGLIKDGHHFTGILFIGLMIENKVPKVIEFNVRFGDPETEVILPRLKSDLLVLINKALDKTLIQEDIIWRDEPCLGVVLTSKGYPESYEKGKIINLPEALNDVIIFHNGTTYKDNQLVTNGGRVLTVVSSTDFKESKTNVYNAIEQIEFEGKTFRKDIGRGL